MILNRRKPFRVDFTTRGGYSGSQEFAFADNAQAAFSRFCAQGAWARLVAQDGDKDETIKEAAYV